MDDNGESLKNINMTGFPFQIAIINEFEKAKSLGWNVLSIEHAWNNKHDGQSGFIDLIVESDQSSVVFIVECKRHLDSSWIFINEKGSDDQRRVSDAFVCNVVKSYINQSFIIDNNACTLEAQWLQIANEPSTPIGNFAMTTKRGQNDLMLEKLSGELLSATEAFAVNHIQANYSEGIKKFYFNLIVTNAELKVCSFDPQVISLDTGKIPESAKIHSVPVVRFRKQLSTRLNSELSTVFVVNSMHLIEFLKNFSVDSTYL